MGVKLGLIYLLRYEWQLENEVVAELIWKQGFKPTDLTLMYEDDGNANDKDDYDADIEIISFKMFRCKDASSETSS